MSIQEALEPLQDPTTPIYSKILLRRELERIEDELLKHKQAILKLEEQKQKTQARLDRLSSQSFFYITNQALQWILECLFLPRQTVFISEMVSLSSCVLTQDRLPSHINAGGQNSERQKPSVDGYFCLQWFQGGSIQTFKPSILLVIGNLLNFLFSLSERS